MASRDAIKRIRCALSLMKKITAGAIVNLVQRACIPIFSYELIRVDM